MRPDYDERVISSASRQPNNVPPWVTDQRQPTVRISLTASHTPIEYTSTAQSRLGQHSRHSALWGCLGFSRLGLTGEEKGGGRGVRQIAEQLSYQRVARRRK